MPTCIPMSDATFSVVTSVYTVGGLMGSLGANLVMDRWGRRGAVRISAIATGAGAALMGVSAGLAPLIVGRTLTGVGAGIGLCVGPIYLSELAPPKKRGAVGVLTQFAIVVGIMITQIMGLQLATATRWRIVLFFSAALGAMQFVLSGGMIESPTWLDRNGLLVEKDKYARRVADIGLLASNYDSQDPLLGADLEATEEDISTPVPVVEVPERNDQEEAIKVPELLVTPSLRRPLTIVCFSMLVQQLSGVNAVLYYSNDILSKALPDWGPWISVGITVVNFLMTFAPIALIDARIGPVPFVMIPEVSPQHAVSALSSVALSLNWIANFLVGLVFLPLRNALSGGAEDKEGRVFYVFATLLAFCTFVLFRVYRG
ncbi:hypothetical protein EVJ58_g8675 [Rhodofomes roseus]|uniref:Major facilitator superfamily (MFS) profile domain-containing protein n=1 Tax=Rhodofomes roseus TaxID=34475 RepID=A0A4Y9XWW8_9APHY|nr:hypothetical protein EVJ58_g8675 [Rhodofomes roseus]